MKKTAILSMAAFYLLLTTGMFVCIVHCAAEIMTEKSPMQMGHAKANEHQHKKHCTGGGDCGCCKKHGEYVIKENLKPGFDYQFSQIAVLVNYPILTGWGVHKLVVSNYTWTDSKAPPGKSGKALSIQLRSLQI